MKSAKTKIRTIVDAYIKMYPSEFKAFKEGMVAVRALPADDFGTLQGSKYTRALYEMPDTLHYMLTKGLDDEEMLWLKTGIVTNRNQGGHWFAKTFPVFCIPNKI